MCSPLAAAQNPVGAGARATVTRRAVIVRRRSRSTATGRPRAQAGPIAAHRAAWPAQDRRRSRPRRSSRDSGSRRRALRTSNAQSETSARHPAPSPAGESSRPRRRPPGRPVGDADGSHQLRRHRGVCGVARQRRQQQRPAVRAVPPAELHRDPGRHRDSRHEPFGEILGRDTRLNLASPRASSAAAGHSSRDDERPPNLLSEDPETRPRPPRPREERGTATEFRRDHPSRGGISAFGIDGARGKAHEAPPSRCRYRERRARVTAA